MNGIKKEYEDWGRFVDDVKRKKIEEVFYTTKAVQPSKESNKIAIYTIFSASQVSKNIDEKGIMYFYLHTSFIGEFPNDMSTADVMGTINPIIDKQFIQTLQQISIPIIIKGQVHEV